MADLGDIQQTDDGRLFEMTGAGWKEVDQEYARQAVSSPANRFISGFAGIESPGVAGALGGMAGVAAMVGAPLGGMAKRKLGRTMAQRVSRQMDDVAAQGERRFTRDLGDVVRGDDPGLARRAAGSAADQVQAAAESIPGLRAIAAIPKERRAAEYNKIVVKALGGDESNLTRAGLIPRKEMDKVVGGIEDSFGAAIDRTATINLGTELTEARQLVKSLPKAERTLFGEALEQGTVSGAQFKSWYQEMSKLSASRSANEVQRKLARSIVKSLDSVAEQSSAINTELWREARQRWRVWLAVRGGKSYTKQSINPTSFRSSLDRIFGDESRLVRTEGKMDEIAELIEAAAEIENLGTAIPSSGTAERLLGAGALGVGAGVLAQ